MAGDVNEMDQGGPSASLDFGQQSQFQSDRHEIASAGSPQPQMPPPGAPQAPPQQQQPPQAAQPGPPQPQQQQPPSQGRLDLKQIFPPMPEIDQMDKAPWRQQLRTWAYHPQAGPALKKLADLIDKQHGPTY